MVKYVNQPQLFGKMLKHAVEYQNGLCKKPDKDYRVYYANIRFKKQIPVEDGYSVRVNHNKIFGVKLVWVSIWSRSKEKHYWEQEKKACGLFILRKKKQI